MGHDLDISYGMKEYSDITITCDDQEFECHKFILASRSPVFKTMFETEMKEKKTGKYEIKCMKVEVFEDLLKYMYSGVAPNIDTIAKELFLAADQYQIGKLRELCEETLCSQIEIKNCIDLLVFGDSYQASTLRKAALNFASKYLKNVETSEWKKKLMPFPDLLIDVIGMKRYNMYKEIQGLLPISYDVWCKTYFEKSDKFTFVWAMPEFASRTENVVNAYMTNSKILNVRQGYFNNYLVARVYPNGQSLEEKGYVSVFINNEDEYQFQGVYVKCVLSSLDISNKKHKLGEFVKNILPWDKQGWPKLISRENLARIAPTGTLTLIFDFQIIYKSLKTIKVENTKSEALTDSYHQKELSHDLDLTYGTSEYSDVTLTCGGREFQCHKIILASRSKVFKTMFEADIGEKTAGKIETNCKKVEVFEDMLKYIYTGVAPNIDTLAKELLETADEYQLDQLKELCEMKLGSSINMLNCIDLLILGDMNQASTLKSIALNFVSKNFKNVASSEWKTKLSDSPSLLIEVMEKIMQDEEEDFGSIVKKAKYS